MNINEFIKKKGISLYFGVAALLCAVVGLILYIATGKTVFTPKLNGAVIALLLVGIALNAATLVYDLKLMKYAGYLVYLFSFLQYVRIEVSYIANVFVSIDGTKFTAAFIFTFLLILVATVVSLISAILKRDRADEDVAA